MNLSFFAGLAVGVAITLVFVLGTVVNRGWRHAVFSGAPLPWGAVFGMRLRGTPPSLIADAYVALEKRGRRVDWPMVEAAYLAEAGRRMEAHELADMVEKRLSDGAATTDLN